MVTKGKCESEEEGGVVCQGMGGTYGVCIAGGVVSMGRVPAGMICVGGVLAVKPVTGTGPG